MASTQDVLTRWTDLFDFAHANSPGQPHGVAPTGSSSWASGQHGRARSLTCACATFFVRPLGSILFGHLGDRHGRKYVLLFTSA
jgi:MFS family permease